MAHLSASTILVLVTFSMVNLVLPPVPAILPMALERWSPFSGFTMGEEKGRESRGRGGRGRKNRKRGEGRRMGGGSTGPA